MAFPSNIYPSTVFRRMLRRISSQLPLCHIKIKDLFLLKSSPSLPLQFRRFIFVQVSFPEYKSLQPMYWLVFLESLARHLHVIYPQFYYFSTSFLASRFVKRLPNLLSEIYQTIHFHYSLHCLCPVLKCLLKNSYYSAYEKIATFCAGLAEEL